MNEPTEQLTKKTSQMMRSRHGVIVFTLVLVVLYTIVTGNLPIFRAHYAAPIEGTIVDADTKKPLSGVVVVANWRLQRDGLFHGTKNLGPLWLHETVTDSHGRYLIPSQFIKLTPPASYFGGTDPLIYFFKPGYEPKTAMNENYFQLSYRQKNSIRRTSNWSTRTILLEKPSRKQIQKYPNKDEYYYRLIQFVRNALARDIPSIKDCNIDSVSKLISTIEKEIIRLEKNGDINRKKLVPTIIC